MVQVAAAILRQNGKLLICRRGPGGSCGGLWEFPGGKLEPGESPEQALVRECDEELGVVIKPGPLFDSFTYAYPEREIQFYFYLGSIERGLAAPRVHTELCWVSPAELCRFPFCPADGPLVERLTEEG